MGPKSCGLCLVVVGAGLRACVPNAQNFPGLKEACAAASPRLLPWCVSLASAFPSQAALA